MPLQGARLADWCGGPAGICLSVGLDCDKCLSIQKTKAEEAAIKEIGDLNGGQNG